MRKGCGEQNLSQIPYMASATQAQRGCRLPRLIRLERVGKQFNPHQGVCLSRWQEAGPGGRKRRGRELHSAGWWETVPGAAPRGNTHHLPGHGPFLHNVSSQPEPTSALRATTGEGALLLQSQRHMGSPGLTPSLCASLTEGTSHEPNLGSLSSVAACFSHRPPPLDDSPGALQLRKLIRGLILL